MKVVCFSLRKLVQEMKTNENCGSKEALKVLEMYKESFMGSIFEIEVPFFQLMKYIAQDPSLSPLEFGLAQVYRDVSIIN